MIALSVAELAAAHDLDLGVSQWRRIDQARINTFADATDDHQWIHVDEAASAAGPFGATIAHGYLTLSLVPAMLSELLEVTDRGRGTNYGLDRVRFTAPVLVGSEVRLAARVIEGSVREDGGAQYRLALRVDVRDQERPAMVAESIYLIYPA